MSRKNLTPGKLQNRLVLKVKWNVDCPKCKKHVDKQLKILNYSDSSSPEGFYVPFTWEHCECWHRKFLIFNSKTKGQKMFISYYLNFERDEKRDGVFPAANVATV